MFRVLEHIWLPERVFLVFKKLVFSKVVSNRLLVRDVIYKEQRNIYAKTGVKSLIAKGNSLFRPPGTFGTMYRELCQDLERNNVPWRYNVRYKVPRRYNVPKGTMYGTKFPEGTMFLGGTMFRRPAAATHAAAA